MSVGCDEGRFISPEEYDEVGISVSSRRSGTPTKPGVYLYIKDSLSHAEPQRTQNWRVASPSLSALPSVSVPQVSTSEARASLRSLRLCVR